MNIHTIAGLVTTGLTAALVSACSGAPSAPLAGDDVELQDKDAAGDAKLPPGTSKKTPSGDKKVETPATPNNTPAPTNPTNPTPDTPNTPNEEPAGENGQPGRISVNEHCCYGGTYYRCPSSNACFGGFDINACLSTCAGPQDPCFDACFQKLSNAGPPKGCQANAPAPNGVDCANGSINL